MRPDKHRFIAYSSLITLLLVLGFALTLPVWGQSSDPYPIPITPGVPLGSPTPEDLVGEDDCYPPQPFSEGDTVFIKAGVNIRDEPSQSSALVWNTMYDNVDERGRPLDIPLAIPARVVGGPVCAQGYNWWQVTGLDNPGWVAEGRPDESGYWVYIPGVGAFAQCDTVYNLRVGQTVDLVDNARVREAADPNSLTKIVVPLGTPVQIIGGPTCIEPYLWWQVRVTVLGFTYEGWMAEAAAGFYYLVPQDLPTLEDGTLCANPLNLTIGARAEVDYFTGPPKTLRIAPDLQSAALFTLVDGVPLIIEGGPICADNFNWWQVRVLGGVQVIGWLSEGSPGIGYWISETLPDDD